MVLPKQLNLIIIIQKDMLSINAKYGMFSYYTSVTLFFVIEMKWKQK